MGRRRRQERREDRGPGGGGDNRYQMRGKLVLKKELKTIKTMLKENR